MSKVKTYAVNCNDAWLNTDGDNISGSYVKYADYMALATKLDLAERACASVVAENAALKDINEWCKTDAFSNMYREFETAKAVGCCNIDCMHDAMVVAIMHAPEVPDTDAFLAEVRAQGVDSGINRVIAMMNHQHPVTSKAIDIMRVHAYQLRKGEWQK